MSGARHMQGSRPPPAAAAAAADREWTGKAFPVNVSAALCQLPVWNKQTQAYLLQAEIGRIKLYAAY